MSIGVVINTYNRAELVGRAIESVLDQRAQDLRVVVVDDGSTDHTPELLSSFDDSLLTVVRHENRGLCASRNAGVACLDTDWIVFLDDDDQLLDGALSVFKFHQMKQVGIIAAGVRRVSELGDVIAETTPAPLYDFFDRAKLSVMPGSFCIRRDVFLAAGAYLEDLLYGHQTEMLLRYWREMRRRGLETRIDSRAVLQYTVREASARPMQNPCYTSLGAARILSHLPWLVSECPRGASAIARVGAVAALRIEEPVLARALFALSRRAEHLSLATLTRQSVAAIPWMRSRVWPDFRDKTKPCAACRPKRSPNYFLPQGYASREEASADRPDKPYWGHATPSDPLNQWPVYKLARRLARQGHARLLIDVGCGTGEKLSRIASRITCRVYGVDQSSGIALARQRDSKVNWIESDLSQTTAWRELTELAPDVVICADVIEHVDDPYALLDGLRAVCRPSTIVVISTPDRTKLEGTTQSGPPANPRHVREWAPMEFELLLRSAGFRVVSHHHRLPRGYTFNLKTIKRLIWRVLNCRRVPDRRSSTIFIANVG